MASGNGLLIIRSAETKTCFARRSWGRTKLYLKKDECNISLGSVVIYFHAFLMRIAPCSQSGGPVGPPTIHLRPSGPHPLPIKWSLGPVARGAAHRFEEKALAVDIVSASGTFLLFLQPSTTSLLLPMQMRCSLVLLFRC